MELLLLAEGEETLFGQLVPYFRSPLLIGFALMAGGLTGSMERKQRNTYVVEEARKQRNTYVIEEAEGKKCGPTRIRHAGPRNSKI
ncbi:hypothetical protein L226DRAFT_538468 [Lentinus tigrinus ALCF2SS1-7]|uniref:Uncharacterized protein n=1 Tax=Lentinus tigrinus ALCF2SS1-6 TaxID=1328759 RepID=A0A5C2S9C2_9APHY|nr:hypothetical protein L227DRAFT_575409 [Lentinus tigrinus ALCF2SS1-6]RPD70865.1 hypothetical protein L226DRAFT_538468 [Lentinus tigrinus ALCF2SS1-7]